MLDPVKVEYYRLQSVLERDQLLLEGLEHIGPIISLDTGQPLIDETEVQRKKLKASIPKLKLALEDYK